MMIAAATSAIAALALSFLTTRSRHAAMNGTTIMNRISFMSRHLISRRSWYINETSGIIQMPTKFRTDPKDSDPISERHASPDPG